MSCPHRAILIVTRDVEGTSTNVARQRIDLKCSLPEGHDGPHRDEEHGEEWTDSGKTLSHILRHEES